MISTRHRAVIEFVLDHLVWFILIAVVALFSLTVPSTMPEANAASRAFHPSAGAKATHRSSTASAKSGV